MASKQAVHHRARIEQAATKSIWLRFALLGGLLVGFGLRLFRLGSESLWYDETVSAYLARLSLAEMIAHTAGDIHPPGYYALLHAWQSLSHPTLEHGLEFLFAWPSLWAGVLLLALLVPIGRRLLGERVAVLAVWLAAVNPFHLWYGQEVRMYTIGAALGLLCLWATLRFFDQESRAWGWLIVYVAAAASGLYTLYYFAFALIALNLLAFIRLRKLKPERRTRALFGWIGAQVAVLLLWLPWLPLFLRQTMDPPVPPWRGPWLTIQAFLASLAETLGALVIGQTPPGGRMWPFALVAVMALGIFLWSWSGGRDETGARSTLLIYILLPLGLLYLFTATVTPLYHVRYVFLFAPPFMLILAAAILALFQQKTWLAWGALALMLGISTWGLYEFWSNPRYRADDHRTAVADLARNWRPDDLILSNAGWIYPTLEIYWPTELVGPLASRPPAITWDGRFTDYADQVRDGLPEGEATAPIIIARTGSVDGDPGLGWGNPASDFFAVTEAETLAALDTLSAAHPRLWHYRLYDTVNDPTGVIRAWLDQNGVLAQDLPYAGRDFLRVQRYDMDVDPALEEEMIPVDARFGDALQLVGRDPHTSVEAGGPLYVNLYWEGLTGVDDPGTDLSFSLRLYEAGSDLLLVQQDVAPQPPTSSWQSGTRVQESFALPVPISAKPLRYTIELVVYRQDTGEPLVPVGDPAHVIDGQRWRVGMIDVFKSPYPSEISERLASFDYIDLTRAALDRAESRAGDEFRTELVWYPNPSDYRDAYDVIIELREADGTVAAAWQQVAGGLNYPSSVWPAGYPLREVRVMPLASELAAGDYAVTLRMARASDGLALKAGTGLGRSTDAVTIGTLRIAAP